MSGPRAACVGVVAVVVGIVGGVVVGLLVARALGRVHRSGVA
ncbi:hypothetical protein [Nonomuraea sp. NPDC003201]